MEQDHIENERVDCRQRLQFLKLRCLLTLQRHEPARLASKSEETSAKGENPGDPVEISNGLESESCYEADGDVDYKTSGVEVPRYDRIVELLHFSHGNVTSGRCERIADQ